MAEITPSPIALSSDAHELAATPSSVAPQLPSDLNLAQGQVSSQVLDPATGKTLEIPHSDLEMAIRSGQYAPIPGNKYGVKDSANIVGEVDGADLADALKRKATVAPMDELHDYQMKKKYGDSQGTAFVEGMGRGAVPYLSDKGLMATGISQEALRERAKQNPISSGLGEAVGFGAALFATAGATEAIGVGLKTAGTLAESLKAGQGAAAAFDFGAGAAAGTGAELASKIGYTGTALGKLATKAGVSNKIALAIVQKTIPAIAGSAVEGAYFNAAHLLNEDALGNAQFNAENLLGSLEQGAIWGAAFGAGAAGAGAIISKTTQVATDALGPLMKKVGSSEIATRKLFGIENSAYLKMEGKNAGIGAKMAGVTKELIEENGGVLKSDMDSLKTGLYSKIENTGEAIGGKYSAVDTVALDTAKNILPNKKDVLNRIANEMEEKLNSEYKNVSGLGAEKSQLQRIVDETRLEAEHATGNLNAREMHEAQMNIDGKIKYLATDSSQSTKQSLLRVQRGIYRSELDNAALKSGIDTAAEKAAGTDLATLNDKYRTMMTMKKAVDLSAEKSATAAGIGKFDAAMGMAGFVTGHSGVGLGVSLVNKVAKSEAMKKMMILARIEKYQQGFTSSVQSGLSAIGSTVSKAEPVVLKSLIDSKLAVDYTDGKKVKPKTEVQAYQNIMQNAQQATANPGMFLQNVNKHSAAYYDVAPKTSGALDSAALNAIGYIANQGKKSTQEKGFFDLDKKNVPNGSDISSLRRKLHVIENPASVVKLMSQGRLSMDHVDALSKVYPEMHMAMQKTILDFLSKNKQAHSSLKYHDKLALGGLLGVAAHESMHYDNVLGLQAAFNTKTDDNSGVVNSTQGGLAKVNKAKRMDNDDSND